MSPSFPPAAAANAAASPASPGAATLPDSPRYVALAGPTASGKTAVALAMAMVRPVEIVSVDSALVYRGMDIGTAKPTAVERAAVPHHLIDILDPHESYSAAAFVADATRLIGEIRARGALPLLVGGTMLYFKALFDGIDAMPAADAAVRARIDTEAATLGWPAMHARLAQVDPVTAARLAPQDSQRIQRALEVWESSGQPLSSFHASDNKTARPVDGGVLFSLEPADRAWLHKRIAERFDAMLAAGFLDEVKALRARGDLSTDLPSMRCVGYRQAWETLDACGTSQPDARAMADLRERGIAATRQLAKRQVTWLRSMPQRTVIACDAPYAVQNAVQLIAKAMTPNSPKSQKSPG
ncbi:MULTISPECIES: tRNA (adenosine(37)-N6)-dimethylallyltransferase MiaA [unclassified Variovorax]|uniref:tRNA (adenosine(37)-N6)-dimethylallyltransferase MiaA n=1 Tax=unclassified Variovorax TaxID=663243 RepID=UPI000D12F8D4|nr:MULTISPECIES: tRNA (adenosine(37)-N6)-dimethylallyltransferase MiaA [unclassified Variovorax]AVQ81009.1 tRNA (adenosine(37)-N6)-dimethylallyltransferase MiaA [Variovorax sp. PMC12]QRY29597.1 tRNA (adenosine(37)-N6)-dimethylallyltransferase MiaA [Variovorax sp. PDNC026]